MPLRFTLKEPENRGYTPGSPFGLYKNGIPLIEVFRLLRGSVNVLDKRSNQLIRITENETRIGAKRSANPVHIFDYLLSKTDGEERASFSDFKNFVDRQKHLNINFFENLRANLILCIVAKKQERYTESFLYFYRILEHVSLAFPLTYALNENDFSKAHVFLKDLFRNERDGDLTAMKSFVPKIAKIGGYENESFDFTFNDISIDDAKACLVQLKRCFPSASKIVDFPDDETVFKFSVSFNSMHSFIVMFRNGMFHDRAGETNFNLPSVGGAEVLCQVVMQEVLHWFSKIYGEIVRTLLKRDL